MILLIDNYDSFSYNLYQLIGSCTDEDIKVIRNDELTVEEIDALDSSHIILSPGPGRPSESGVCEEVALKLKSKVPILGICLGHQGICEVHGAKVTYAKELMHGKQSIITFDENEKIFKGLGKSYCEEQSNKNNSNNQNATNKIKIARYHSLAASEEGFPEELKIIAKSDDGEIMAVKHKDYDLYGFQFHPESVLTEDGDIMMKNFLNIKK